MSKRIIVNTHIEKTAGTSLLRFFETVLGKKRIAFYDPTTDTIIRASDLPFSPSNDWVDKLQLKSYAFWPVLKKLYFQVQAPKRSSDTIPENTVIVHGHFTADRFDNFFENPIRTIVIRDPLYRTLSHYDHWKRSKGRCHWRVIVPYDPALSFEEYAMLPKMRNFQMQAMAGKDLSEFDLVGLAEDMDGYVASLLQIFKEQGYVPSTINYPPQKKLNQRKKTKLVFSPGFEEAFGKFHKEDYALHKKAREIAQKTIRSMHS